MTDEKKKKSSKNYLEQVSNEIERQFAEVELGLSTLETNVISLLQKKVRESFKNGIEVGQKKSGKAEKNRKNPKN